MKAYRELGITQKTTWHLTQRIREGFFGDAGNMTGPVEVDEIYLGGKRKNMSNAKRRELTGRGPVGKTAVVGAKGRATKQVVTKVVDDTKANTLQGLVADPVGMDALLLEVFVEAHPEPPEEVVLDMNATDDSLQKRVFDLLGVDPTRFVASNLAG